MEATWHLSIYIGGRSKGVSKGSKDDFWFSGRTQNEKQVLLTVHFFFAVDSRFFLKGLGRTQRHRWQREAVESWDVPRL